MAMLARSPRKECKHGDMLKALTVGLVDTYSRCSNNFKYSEVSAPRRVLTKYPKGIHNRGYDNSEYDYICRVGDRIEDPDGQALEIVEALGHGSFGQVLKCQPVGPSSSGRQPIALKIIKNKPAYFRQALVEVTILKVLNTEFDPDNEKQIVRMLDFFVFRRHLCIVFELLIVNLYDVLKRKDFCGFSLALIRDLTAQLLKALQCLREANVIHCDLKPENVMLSSTKSPKIKLCDLGSSCFGNLLATSYIQSRFYRSPEVMLGLRYTHAIDMWSLGCICAELFLGLPIFPGHSEYDQMCRIVKVLGVPPACMLEQGKNTRRYFRRTEAPTGPGPAGLKSDGSDACVERSVGEVAGPGDSCGSSEAPAGQAGSPGPGVHGGRGTGSRAGGKTGACGTSGDSRSSLGSLASTAADTSSDVALAKAPDASAPTEEELAAAALTGGVPHQLPPAARSRCTCGSKSCNGKCGSSSSRRRSARVVWRMKTREEFEREEHKKEQTPRQRWNFNSLEQMMQVVPLSPDLSDAVRMEEQDRRRGLTQLLGGLLRLQPEERWTACQALRHPFVLGTPTCEDWRPPPPAPVPPPPAEALSPACASGVSAVPDGENFKGGGSSGSRVLRGATAKIPLPSEMKGEIYRPPIDELKRDLCGGVVFGPVPQQQGACGTGAAGSIDHRRRRASGGGNSDGGGGPGGTSPGSSAPSTNGSPQPGGRAAVQGQGRSSGRGGTAAGHGRTGQRPPATPETSSQGSLPPPALPWPATPASSSQAALSRLGIRSGSGSAGAGSQVSSPWHLSSHLSTNSAASDSFNSSQHSGSDAASHLHAVSSEEPSCSDGPVGNRSGHGSAAAAAQNAEARAIQSDSSDGKESVGSAGSQAGYAGQAGARLADFSRPLTTASTQPRPAPRTSASVPNFREAVGMNSSGPVTVQGAQRDAISGQFIPPARSSASGGGSGGSASGRRSRRRVSLPKPTDKSANAAPSR